MNAISSGIATPLHPMSERADGAWAAASRSGLQRTLQALFRENLLNLNHLIVEGAISWLPLWSRQAMLRFEGLSVGRIGNCELTGQVSCYQHGERPRALPTASALLAFVANALPHAVAAIDIARLIRELDNSNDNDALCLRYRQQWGAGLAAQVRQGGHVGLLAMLMRAPASQFANPALLLEQWGTLGHPWHPGYKTKMGLTAQEVMALSPEFQAPLSVPVAALRASLAHVATTDGRGDYRAWFAAAFPQQMARFEAALSKRGLAGADYLPLPLHPYQASRCVPVEFAAEIARGDLVLLESVAIEATPTMSFRTVVPFGDPALPHLKLPVSLRLTSVQRTVSPKSAVMGPRLTCLLERILAAEDGFGGTLDIVGERTGVHYRDPDGDDNRSRHLAILYRDNPMAKRSAALFPVPAGALFAESPLDGRALVTELVAAAYGDHADGALAFFRCYADTVLRAVLGAYLLYGIGFEAHQQNSFIMVDNEGRPAQLLVRDFGDLRVHGPTLERAGLALDVFRADHTVFDTDEPVRDKLLHAVMLCHLSELGLLLARSYRHSEAAFWGVLRGALDAAFERLRARSCPQRWARERDAVLEARWPAKAFLRMRLSDTSDDVHGDMANPLAACRP